MPRIDGKFYFKLAISEDGRLAQLLQVTDHTGKIVNPEMFDPVATRYLRARLDTFKHPNSEGGTQIYEKMGEDGSGEQPPSVTLIYLIRNSPYRRDEQ